MPIYEFKCSKCSHRFEKLCPMDEDGKNLQCPECGAGKPNRVMSTFSAKKTGEEPGNTPAVSSGCSSCAASSCSSCGS